jgi:hypothetical protein
MFMLIILQKFSDLFTLKPSRWMVENSIAIWLFRKARARMLDINLRNFAIPLAGSILQIEP